MKSLVCISRTPETTARIAFSEGNKEFVEEGVNFIMNPYDEWYALVKAIEIQEQEGGSVTLVHVGTENGDQIIRKGLAIGADDAIRINAEPRDSYFVAHQIAGAARAGEFDLIFLGKETIDYNGSEVAPMVAELLDLPFISYANNLTLEDGKLTINREIEGGVEVIEVRPPVVISAAKGLAEQRIPNMRGIMMAKRKPLDVRDPVEVPVLTSLQRFEKPDEEKEVQMIDPEQMDELVRLLHEEAKVI
jgi:electron transfer flavoprotein beta subunit